MGNASKDTVTCRFKILRSTQITQTNKTVQAEVSFTPLEGLHDPISSRNASAKVQVSTAVFSHNIFQVLYNAICTGDRC